MKIKISIVLAVIIQFTVLFTGVISAAPLSVNTSTVVNTNTCDKITWTDSSGLVRSASIVKYAGNPSGFKGGYITQLTYMDGAAVTCNESNPAADLSGLGMMINHQPTGYAGRGWANSKQDGFNGTTSIIFQGANHVIYETEMDMYGDNGNTAKGAWKVKWQYMIRTGNDFIVDAISYDFSSKPFGTYGNDIRSPYFELNWTGTGAANTLSEAIDGIEFCASNNTGASYIFKTVGSSPFSGGYTFNTPGRNIPYTLQWKNSPDREAGYVSTLDLTQFAAGGGYLSGPVNIGATGASMPPNWAINYQSNGFQGWYGDKMTWALPYGAAGGETAAESGTTTKSTFPDWTWRKNWTAYPVVGFTLLINIGKKTADGTRNLVAEQADIHSLASGALTAANGTVVTTGKQSLYDTAAFTLKPAGYNHMYHTWEVNCNADQADVTLALGAVSLKNQTFVFNNYNSAAVPAVSVNSVSLNDGVEMFASVDTVNKKLYVTFNQTFTGSVHITAGGVVNTPTPPAVTATPTPGGTVTGGADCVNYSINYSAVPSKVFMKKLTLKAHIGDCTSATVTVDGVTVPSSYNAATKLITFNAEGVNIVINRVGYTSGATYAVTKATLYNDKKWAYSMTFDDARPSVRTVVMPIMDGYGWTAGLGLNTQGMAATTDGYVMSWASADILRAKGWSFFDHNYSHQALTCANITTETVPVINSINARWADYKCTHFVYPYVNTTDYACLVSSGLLLSAENFYGNNYADVVPANTFLLSRGAIFAAGNASTAALANAMADNAAADGRNRWLINFTHDVAPGSTAPATTYDTNEAVLGAHLAYVYNTYGAGGTDNLWFAPTDEVMHYMLTRQNAAVSYIGAGACGAVTPVTPTYTFTPSNTPVVTPTSSAVCLFDDIDDGDTANNYGGFWYAYKSADPAFPADTWIWPAAGGASCSPTAGGANSSAYAMRMTGSVGAINDPQYPCIGLGSQFAASAGVETDISSCGGIRFYVKGDGKSYLVKIPYTNIAGATLTGYDDYKFVFTAPAAWTQVSIPFSSMLQAGWGIAVEQSIVLTHAKEIQWQTNFNGTAGVPAAADLWVDSIEIYGCATCPGAPAATATDTPPVMATYTLTPTFTQTFTAVSTNTFTATNTVPAGSTNTPTFTPSNTPVNTNTFTATNTVPAWATNTPTFTPSNTPVITNTFTVVPTVSNPSLSVGLNAAASVTVGQELTVVMTVNNNGNSVISGILPSTLNMVGAGTSLLAISGPVPANVASLPIGGSTTFTWIYSAASTGMVIIQGTASGNSGAVVSNLGMTGGTDLAASATPVPTATATQQPGSVLAVVTLTPVVIGPNPNTIAGTQTDRVVYFEVNRPVSKIVFKVYSINGRLIRKSEDSSPRPQGKCAVNIDSVYFKGLAKGVYYYMLTAFDQETGKEVKAPLGTVLIQ